MIKPEMRGKKTVQNTIVISAKRIHLKDLIRETWEVSRMCSRIFLVDLRIGREEGKRDVRKMIPRL